MSRRQDPHHSFQSPSRLRLERQTEHVVWEQGSEDLQVLASDLQAQEQNFLRRLREGPVPLEVILHLADAQAALRAARRAFEREGNMSLLVLDPQ